MHVLYLLHLSAHPISPPSHHHPCISHPLHLTLSPSLSLPFTTPSDGFCTGLAKAKVFVPLLSKEGINNPDRHWQNFSKLTETSPCDNVFLEYRMALDLCSRGLVDKVFPVFFPDAVTKKSYTFRAGPGTEASHPVCPAGVNVCVCIYVCMFVVFCMTMTVAMGQKLITIQAV